MWETTREIEHFINEFEACRLPKSRWTHEAHLLVGLWYLSRHPPTDALDIVRKRIRTHNESVGTANTDRSGYHETLTRFYLAAIGNHHNAHRDKPLPASLALLLKTPLANKDYALAFYSRERLFSVSARHAWVTPDLTPGEPIGTVHPSPGQHLIL